MSAERRIYDDSNHRCYGPVRRLHVMLMQLTAEHPEGMAVLDRLYSAAHGGSLWDSDLAFFTHVMEYAESRSQRIVMRRCLQALA